MSNYWLREERKALARKKNGMLTKSEVLEIKTLMKSPTFEKLCNMALLSIEGEALSQVMSDIGEISKDENVTFAAQSSVDLWMQSKVALGL